MCLAKPIVSVTVQECMDIGKPVVGITKIAPAVSNSFWCIKAKIIHSTFSDKIAVWTAFQPNNRVRLIIVDTVRANDDRCADLKAFDGSIHNAPPSFRFSLLIKKRPT